MKDKLSYSQLYTELESLNTSAFDSILNEDFEEFQNTIDEFINSGIMEQEEFASAREAYRYSSMPFTLDGMWISVDSRNPLDKPITDFSGLPIQDLNKRDVQPFYAYMTQHEKTEKQEEDSKIAGKRIDAFNTYVELYKNLYKDPSPQKYMSNPLVDDAEKHKMIYINRVTELATARSKFYMTCDFTCLPVKGMNIIDNEKLKNSDVHGKIKYLTENFGNLYSPGKNKNKITECFSFKGYEKILASNYLQGKNIDRKNWKRYTKGTLPEKLMFYLQLAFYLTIPSSAEIERFMNLHGYSIKGNMTRFSGIVYKKKTYPVLHRDLCRWIDAGIDYNLINEICGYKLEIKEIRKPKAK